MAAVTILDFPNELLLGIFAYLVPPTDDDQPYVTDEPASLKPGDLLALLGVCRAWRVLVADPSLWRGVTVPWLFAMLLVRHHPQIRLQVLVDVHMGHKRTRELQQMATGEPKLIERLRAAVVGLAVNDGLSNTHHDLLLALFGEDNRVISRLNAPNEILPEFDWLPCLTRVRVVRLPVSVEEMLANWPLLKDVAINAHDGTWYDVTGSLPNIETIRIHSGAPGAIASILRGCPNARSLHLNCGYASALRDAAVAARIQHLVVSEAQRILEVQRDRGTVTFDAGLSSWASRSWTSLRRLELVVSTSGAQPDGGAKLTRGLGQLFINAPLLQELSIRVVNSGRHDEYFPFLLDLRSESMQRAAALRRILLTLESDEMIHVRADAAGERTNTTTEHLMRLSRVLLSDGSEAWNDPAATGAVDGEPNRVSRWRDHWAAHQPVCDDGATLELAAAPQLNLSDVTTEHATSRRAVVERPARLDDAGADDTWLRGWHVLAEASVKRTSQAIMTPAGGPAVQIQVQSVVRISLSRLGR